MLCKVINEFKYEHKMSAGVTLSSELWSLFCKHHQAVAAIIYTTNSRNVPILSKKSRYRWLLLLRSQGIGHDTGKRGYCGGHTKPYRCPLLILAWL